MARLYSNENFPFDVVRELRRIGHDVLTIQETGRANQRTSDDDVLEFAIQAGRALLTLNRRDFRKLHRNRPDHKGIIACTTDRDFPRQAARIHDAIKDLDDLSGRLIQVYRPSR